LVHFFLLLFSCWLNFVPELVGSQPGHVSSFYFNFTPPVFRCYLFRKKVYNTKVVSEKSAHLRGGKSSLVPQLTKPCNFICILH
jgi:hypothetical protein